MRLLAAYVSVFICLIPSLAFPGLHRIPDNVSDREHIDAIKSVLSSFTQHPSLVRTIESLNARQLAEVKAWKDHSNRDPATHLLNSTIYVASESRASVGGLMRFPEDDFPFVAPGQTDQRGPCPGMNTLANHGYLPRNGIVNAGQVFEATARVFNMATDLAAVLIAGAIALNGDIRTLTFSIGTPYKPSLRNTF